MILIHILKIIFIHINLLTPSLEGHCCKVGKIQIVNLGDGHYA